MSVRKKSTASFASGLVEIFKKRTVNSVLVPVRDVAVVNNKYVPI